MPEDPTASKYDDDEPYADPRNFFSVRHKNILKC